MSASNDLTARVWTVDADSTQVLLTQASSARTNDASEEDAHCVCIIEGFTEYYMEPSNQSYRCSNTQFSFDLSEANGYDEITRDKNKSMEQVLQLLESPPYLDGNVSLCVETLESAVFVVGSSLHIWKKNMAT